MQAFCATSPQGETVCRWLRRETLPHPRYGLPNGFAFSPSRWAYSASYAQMDSSVGIHYESFAHTARHTLGSRRSRVIGEHYGTCHLRIDPSEILAVDSCVVALRSGHLRSNLAQARQVVRARRRRRSSTADFSAGISNGLRGLAHRFVDGPVLKCALILVGGVDGEGCLRQALSTIALLVPKAGKPSIQC